MGLSSYFRDSSTYRDTLVVRSVDNCAMLYEPSRSVNFFYGIKWGVAIFIGNVYVAAWVQS